jgi:hypothetical protein
LPAEWNCFRELLSTNAENEAEIEHGGGNLSSARVARLQNT